MERLRQILDEVQAFLRGLVWPVVTSVRGNIGLAGFSIVLGFALWIFVTDTESPTRTGDLPFRLEVQAVNLPGDLEVANNLFVRVRVEVDDDVWNTLTPDDFRATVDLEGLQVGTYDLPVRVEALTGRGGLRVTRVNPDTVTVELEPFFSKSVPVSVVLENAPHDYEATIVEQDVDTVLVAGTRDNVNRVAKVEGTLDLTGRTDDITQAVRLQPLDSREEPVGPDEVSLEPSVVNVTVEITQKQYSTPLAIEAVVVGSPAAGYDVVDTAVDPSVITVFGPQSFIAEAASIPTQPVDITGATEDVVQTVSLDLPPDVSVSGGASATVTVQIEPAQGQRTFGVTAVVVGLDPDLTVGGALPLVEVELLGELPTLRALRANDVTATINLSGLEEGTHTVSVSVSAPAGTLVAEVSPKTFEVTLEPR